MLLDERVTALAPDPAQSRERVAALRGDVLDRALRSEAPVPSRRRWVAGGLAAATAAAALVVGPTLLPTHEGASPNPLAALAMAAVESGQPELGEGQAVHRVWLTEIVKDGVITNDLREEQWTLADGERYYRTTWHQSTGEPQHGTDTSHMTADDGGALRPARIAQLPTEPDALLERLGAISYARGEKDPEKNVSVRRALLLEILWGGYAPAKVWAAALEALETFPGLEVDTGQSGLTTVTVTFPAGRTSDVHTITFRNTDGAMVSRTSNYSEGEVLTTEVPVLEVVDAVPDEVKAAAAAQRAKAQAEAAAERRAEEKAATRR